MLMLSVALAACGGSAERETDESVRILSFVAEPEEIREGEVATLSWRTKNAKKLHLYAGEEEIELPEGSAAEGSLEVKPESTTNYLLVAEGAEGAEARAGIWVTLIAPEGPFILRFEADPADITYGESSTLSWTVADVDSVALLAGEKLLLETSLLEDSYSVSPTETTTYTLVTTRDETELRRDLTLFVRPRIDRFEVTPPMVTASPGTPGPVTLEWEVSGAASIEILGDGVPLPLEDLDPSSGAAEYQVESPMEFTLVATGRGDPETEEGALHSTAEAQVETVGEPVVRVEGPTAAKAGVPFLLRWEAENVSVLHIVRDGLTVAEDADPVSGEIEQTLASSATYTFRASNEAGRTHDVEWRVEVTP